MKKHREEEKEEATLKFWSLLHSKERRRISDEKPIK